MALTSLRFRSLTRKIGNTLAHCPFSTNVSSYQYLNISVILVCSEHTCIHPVPVLTMRPCTQVPKPQVHPKDLEKCYLDSWIPNYYRQSHANLGTHLKHSRRWQERIYTDAYISQGSSSATGRIRGDITEQDTIVCLIHEVNVLGNQDRIICVEWTVQKGHVGEADLGWRNSRAWAGWTGNWRQMVEAGRYSASEFGLGIPL